MIGNAHSSHINLEDNGIRGEGLLCLCSGFLSQKTLASVFSCTSCFNGPLWLDPVVTRFLMMFLDYSHVFILHTFPVNLSPPSFFPLLYFPGLP